MTDTVKKTIESLKAAAFPVLVAVVLWFGTRLLDQAEKTGDNVFQVRIDLEGIKSKFEEHDRRIERLEEKVQP